MSKSIVLLSGGLDSAVALWWAKRKWQVYALTFKFGALNSNEVRSAKKIARLAKVTRHIILDLKWLKQMSELGRTQELRGHRRSRFPLTYIPSRNAIFFGIASYYAEIYGARYIVTGHNLEDPFPDSKPTYVKAMNVALSRGSWLGKQYETRIIAPFGSAEKAAILKLGARLRAPLAFTWSCHRNRKTPCGKCGGCISRSKAFKELKLEDDGRSRIRRL